MRRARALAVKLQLAAFLLVVSLAPSWSARAQIVGTSSLITIPVADMPADGTVTFGGGFVNKRYSEYLGGRADFTPLYVSAQFLPFVEVAFRFSRPLDLDDRERLGDRMVSARIRVLTEMRNRPAVVVGMHDFLTVEERNYFNALYAVASKHVAALIPIGLHAGYGTDLMDALAYQFVGPFGGLSLTVIRNAEVLLEYDADRINAGVRVNVFDRFRVLLALQGMETVIAGASLILQL